MVSERIHQRQESVAACNLELPTSSCSISIHSITLLVKTAGCIKVHTNAFAQHHYLKKRLTKPSQKNENKNRKSSNQLIFPVNPSRIKHEDKLDLAFLRTSCCCVAVRVGWYRTAGKRLISLPQRVIGSR